MQRDESYSLTAQKLIFGYLVSGLLMYVSFKQVNPTHVLKCDQDN